jgi:hypothetical protein
MDDAVCMIFFAQGGTPHTLDDAARRMAESGLTVVQGKNGLAVSWDGGPEMQVSLSQAPHVVAEAIEIGEDTLHADAMARCNARFEIAISDLDDALDEMNTLIEVQSSLQDLTGGCMFNSWNGELTGPEDGA